VETSQANWQENKSWQYVDKDCSAIILAEDLSVAGTQTPMMRQGTPISIPLSICENTQQNTVIIQPSLLGCKNGRKRIAGQQACHLNAALLAYCPIR
jgi:hypothetical protein